MAAFALACTLLPSMAFAKVDKTLADKLNAYPEVTLKTQDFSQKLTILLDDQGKKINLSDQFQFPHMSIENRTVVRIRHMATILGKEIDWDQDFHMGDRFSF